MNRKEIVQLLSMAVSNFPSMQDRDMKPTAELWQEALLDIEFDVAKKALIKVLATSRFFPTIAEIRQASTQITEPRTMDAIEAWGLIIHAIRKYGHYREKEALESLPYDVAEMAKRFTWRELCLNENPDTLRAQFRMAWETQSKRKDELKVLPAEVRELIEGMTVKLKLEGW